MKIYSSTYGMRISAEGEFQPTLVLVKTPVVWYAIESVYAVACRWTGHRFCTTRLFEWFDRRVAQKQSDFSVPVDMDTVLAFTDWRGWDTPTMLVELDEMSREGDTE